MNAEQAAMMLKLQQLGFTLDDLQIYLDTHPYDGNAIERYNATATEYQNLAAQYSTKFTPLSEDMPSNREDEWAWGLDDYPWDF